MSTDAPRAVAMVTSLEGPTNYARFLTSALADASDWKVVTITERNALRAPDGVAQRRSWQPGPTAYTDIIRAVNMERPALVHIQHELTWYGGPISTALFPLLVIGLRLSGFQVVTTIHAVVTPWEVDDDFLRTFSFPRSRWRSLAMILLFRLLYRTVGAASNAVVVHSNSLKKDITSAYGVAQEKVHVIPIGVTPARNRELAAPTEEPWWKHSLSTQPFFLCFGYLHRRKGLEFLIQAFHQFGAQHPGHHLVIAGGTLDYQRDYADFLRRQASTSSVGERILFTGFINPPVIQWLHANCIAAILPHAFSVSASMPLAFAFEFGRPVICSAIGTLVDEVVDGVNGLLVEPRSADAIQGAMERITTDQGLRTRLAIGTETTAKQRSWLRCAARTASLYDQILAAKHR